MTLSHTDSDHIKEFIAKKAISLQKHWTLKKLAASHPEHLLHAYLGLSCAHNPCDQLNSKKDRKMR
jgi:hypothetical protein